MLSYRYLLFLEGTYCLNPAATKEARLKNAAPTVTVDEQGNILASEQAGAFGFVRKESGDSQLLAGIRAARRGPYSRHSVMLEILANKE
ncbi:MAG: hypothetical protein IMY78_02730 [Chloroflexi bacterium]|jgi:DNA-binding NarL/FixJ family response regulator|nr:hypothetical protein [Chloroflexota bacterium]